MRYVLRNTNQIKLHKILAKLAGCPSKDKDLLEKRSLIYIEILLHQNAFSNHNLVQCTISFIQPISPKVIKKLTELKHYMILSNNFTTALIIQQRLSPQKNEQDIQ